MPLFRGVEWPRDHRDELVAGALVAAVVIVLGYASGIGAPAASGAAEAALPPASPPAATAPEATAPGAGQVPAESGELPAYGGAGSDLGHGGTGSDIGYGDAGSAVTGTGPVDGSGGQGGGGHTGHESSPPAGTPTPAPTPTPSPSATCRDGEVTLVQPLLVGLTEPVLGLLGGATASPSPTPSPSPCVGLAPVSGLLGGALAGSPSASPRPEATP
jgi:hypothetical protein